MARMIHWLFTNVQVPRIGVIGATLMFLAIVGDTLLRLT